MAAGINFSTWGRRHQMPLVMQTEATECALACLVMIGCYYGHDIDLPSLRRRFSTSLKGVDLKRVVEIAHGLGFEARPLRAEIEYLSDAQLPCILHWDLNHFVVLNSVSRDRVEIYDPALGRLRLSLSETGKHFTGVVLELTPGADFAPVQERQRVSLRSLTGQITGLTRALIQVSGLALAIEIIGLVLPFQIQWIIDQVLLTADKNLLLTLTIGFLAAMVLHGALSIARAWVISWLGATLSAQWSINLFSHLLRLPLDYFEKRHMGDIMSRFASVRAIQNTITSSFVEALLDGLMGSLTLVVLCLFSPLLTLAVVVVILMYGFLRWAMYRTMWRVNEEQLVYGAKQQSELMESVRGIQAIKLANKQSERRARLANATLEEAKRSMRSQRYTLAFAVTNQSLFGAQRICLIGMGAYMAIEGKFSAGMLVAYVAYADQFATKIGSLIDKVVDFRMLRLHAERIGDVALAAPERHAQGVYSGPEPDAQIEVRNVSFRYAEGEPWVLRNLSLTINAGQSFAIVGPSGCGKSTLAKLLVGLLTPTEGNIQIGGIDIRQYGLDNYRRLIGAVMQDDTLFAGSIAENIALFDSGANINAIIEAASMAEIHHEVMAMPMAYESRVGDMGSALSGGQIQRLILARALYRKPKLLVLDEATSHLDAVNERLTNDTVRSLNVTRVILAHRKETIELADRVFDLAEARFAEREEPAGSRCEIA